VRRGKLHSHDKGAIESINARLRRAVNARGHFPTEQAALNAFDITFDGRLTAGKK
jgi:putative transposase